MEPAIRSVADTALWVAVYRAEESERKDAIFKDPYARRLAGERGFNIVESMEAGRKTVGHLLPALIYLTHSLCNMYRRATI